MATKAHKLLTGTDLHEPKGVATAIAGQVYVSDGAGSGSWQTINTTVDFSTGDVKLTFKNVADTGWLMMDDSTIGSPTSGAHFVSTEFQALYELIWTNIPPAWTTISGGRGGSAAADWAANKTITLPKMLGRALAIAGAGSGLTSRGLGEYLGAETTTLALADLPTGITSANTGSVAISVTNTGTNPYRGTSALNSQTTFGGGTEGLFADVTAVTNSAMTSTGTISASAISVTSNNTSGGAHTNMQPTAFVNVMVKY